VLLGVVVVCLLCAQFYTFVVSVYSTVVLIPAFMEIFGYDNNDSDDKMNDSEEAFIFLAVGMFFYLTRPASSGKPLLLFFLFYVG
jgi:hypothetical protein